MVESAGAISTVRSCKRQGSAEPDLHQKEVPEFDKRQEKTDWGSGLPRIVRDAREVQDLITEKTEHDDDIDDSRGGKQESANDRLDDPAQPDESAQLSDGAPHYDGGENVGQPNNHRQSDQASYFSECMS
ncbi:hypothetical protein F442_22757 [Phytophthora nicotianae P10297]|uniref:Uncharacterized protein n=3 Tax=Phytophthora nicotianae TaxID=4792 RepID=V9DTB2_PHYNI|nr:hypothetical protein F443_22776 [Phytophthora nicotianae P1569]ETP27958.1 hypothetical protein F442_22757 [Phytophthora nicotianae P10297]